MGLHVGVLLALCALGCGDDDAGLVPVPDAGVDAGDTGPIAIAGYCDALIAAVCPEDSTCPQCRPEGGARMYHQQQCEQAVRKVELGSVSFDGDAAGSCVEHLGTLQCQFAIYDGVCARVFEGRLSSGAKCTPRGTNECRDGFCETSEECPGTCIAYRTVDQSCGEAGQQCAPDLICDNDTCKRRLPEGVSCQLAQNACAARLQCIGDEGDDMTCERLASIGETCEGDEACEWPLTCFENECRLDVPRGSPCRTVGNCSDGDRCYAMTPGEGARCLPAVDVGDVCADLGDACASGARCQYQADGMSRCVLPAEDGESCQYNSCAQDLVCIQDAEGGHCSERLANGADCEQGFVCESNVCRDGVCAGPGDEGDACESHNDESCKDDLYCKRDSIDTNEGVCTEREPIGESCLERAQTGASVCVENAHCTCTLPPPEEGEDNECYETVDPEAWECRALLDDGDACTENAACESAACIAGKCKAYDDLSATERFCVEERE